MADFGRYPKWSRTTKELFYRTFDSKIMVAPYTVTGESFAAGKAQLWSTGQFTERLGSVNFDIHPDGKRFVVLKTPPSKEGSATSRFTFVFNFFDDLRRKAPSPKWRQESDYLGLVDDLKATRADYYRSLTAWI